MAQMTDVGVTWSNQEPGTQAAPLPPYNNIYDFIQAVNSEATDEDLPKLTTGFLRSLWKLGFTDLHYITSQEGKRFLILPDLRRKYPDMNMRPEHAISDNYTEKEVCGEGNPHYPTTISINRWESNIQRGGNVWVGNYSGRSVGTT